jgi:hypothetical protein
VAVVMAELTAWEVAVTVAEAAMVMEKAASMAVAQAALRAVGRVLA